MSNRTTYIENTNTPRIPEGIYDLRFIEHETGIRFGRKVFLWFEVISDNEHNGTKLARYYNVTKHIGRTGKKGRFSAGPKSKFVREHVTVFGNPPSLDQISVDNYYGVTVKGQVKTVTSDSTRVDIPEILQYSTISELISLNDSNNLAASSSEHEESFEDKDTAESFIDSTLSNDNTFRELPDTEFLEDSNYSGYHVLDRSTGELKFIPSEPENDSEQEVWNPGTDDETFD